MKKRIFFLGLAAILSILIAANPRTQLRHPPIPKESLETEKVSIVQLETAKSKQQIESMLTDYPGVQLRYVFEHSFTGFSVKGKLASLEKLANQHEVVTLSHVKTYKVTSGLQRSPVENHKVTSGLQHSPVQNHKVTSDLQRSSVQNQTSDLQHSPIQTYEFTNDENFELIGSERVRGFLDKDGRRLSGKGVKVGVIDTGVDYNHPDLRRNYRGGQDLVDGDKDPMETKGMFAQDTLHGTHVAGIIAANGRMRGMAPEAEIVAYRALGPGGMGTTEQVLAAIEQAIKDKVDIINLSLGNSVNGPDLPISLALNKAVEKGVVAVTSSGNSGPNIWTVGSPGTASKAISVGASTPPMDIPYLHIEGMEKPIRLDPLHGSKAWDIRRMYELSFSGLGKEKDFRNVKDKIVLLERGEITFTEKAQNAAKAGAKAVIIYNNTNGSFIGNLEAEVPIPVASVSKEQGLQVKKKIEQQTIFTRIHLIEEKDFIADFSSRGPVTDTWEIKPDIVAPGVAINSTIPGGYLPLQGTSMAAPHVAGACALIKQAHPEWGPKEIKAALMNTAIPLVKKNGQNYFTFEQGAGRIQAEKAVKTETLAMPGSLQFGKFQLADRMHQHQAVIEVRNVGEEEKEYYFSIPKNEKGIKWEFPHAFTVKPGESKKITIGMEADPNVFKKKIHDGILVLNEGVNKTRIPYIYVLEEPDYPRVMGFDFVPGDKEGTYRYEVYLPGGAEEFGIALFDPDNYQFKGFLDWQRDINKGLIQKELTIEELPREGTYLAKVFAKKSGKEDMVEVRLNIFYEKGNSRFHKNPF